MPRISLAKNTRAATAAVFSLAACWTLAGTPAARAADLEPDQALRDTAEETLCALGEVYEDEDPPPAASVPTDMLGVGLYLIQPGLPDPIAAARCAMAAPALFPEGIPDRTAEDLFWDAYTLAADSLHSATAPPRDALEIHCLLALSLHAVGAGLDQGPPLEPLEVMELQCRVSRCLEVTLQRELTPSEIRQLDGFMLDALFDMGVPIRF